MANRLVFFVNMCLPSGVIGMLIGRGVELDLFRTFEILLSTLLDSDQFIISSLEYFFIESKVSCNDRSMFAGFFRLFNSSFDIVTLSITFRFE